MDDTSSQENLLYDTSVYVRCESFIHVHSWYWTGTSLQLRPMLGVVSSANDINLFLMIFPRMSLHCKLVPIQYENKNMVYSKFDFDIPTASPNSHTTTRTTLQETYCTKGKLPSAASAMVQRYINTLV